MPARHRAGRPPAAATPGPGLTDYAGLRTEVAGAFTASEGGCGYRRIKAALKTGVSEKAVRGIVAGDGPTAHVPERRG